MCIRDRGEDVHRATAAEIFGVTPIEVGADQRRVAKVINFGLIYGMSAFGLARQLDIERSAAQAYICLLYTSPADRCKQGIGTHLRLSLIHI